MSFDSNGIRKKRTWNVYDNSRRDGDMRAVGKKMSKKYILRTKLGTLTRNKKETNK